MTVTENTEKAEAFIENFKIVSVVLSRDSGTLPVIAPTLSDTLGLYEAVEAADGDGDRIDELFCWFFTRMGVDPDEYDETFNDIRFASRFGLVDPDALLREYDELTAA